MKIKIILLLLISASSFLAWLFFIENFSQEPLEIIIEKPPENSEKELETKSENIENPNFKEKTEIKKENLTNEEINRTKSAEIKTDELNKNSFVINKKVSWGFSLTNNRTIDTLIIHSSYDALRSDPYDFNGLIAVYKEYQVAPHFLIDRKGKIHRLVDEKNIAYHAGVSKMPDGRTGVNNFSIGIELMNTKDDEYTSDQYGALNKLIDYLKSQYKIKYILGHKDISPNRKTDPWNFNWDKIEN